MRQHIAIILSLDCCILMAQLQCSVGWDSSRRINASVNCPQIWMVVVHSNVGRDCGTAHVEHVQVLAKYIPKLWALKMCTHTHKKHSSEGSRSQQKTFFGIYEAWLFWHSHVPDLKSPAALSTQFPTIFFLSHNGMTSYFDGYLYMVICKIYKSSFYTSK